VTGQVLCIIPGPSKVLAEKPAHPCSRWCFGCRKHLPHSLVLLGDEEPGWYDPVAVLRCSRCGKDCTRFPS
jgi:hypothetical protein